MTELLKKRMFYKNNYHRKFHFILWMILFIFFTVVVRIYGDELDEYSVMNAFGYNARVIALGGTLGAITSDVDTIFLNPAGISRFKSQELNVTYNIWVNGMSYESIGYITPLNGVTLGLTAIYENKLSLDMDIDNFFSHNLTWNLSVGKKYEDIIMLGVNVKGRQEETSDEITNSVVVDFAGLYNVGIAGVTIGFGIQNIGTKIKSSDLGGELPLNFNLGGTYTAFDDTLFLGLDLNSTIGGGYLINSGIEFTPFNFIALRTGYRILFTPAVSVENVSRMSAGIGLNILKFHVDYAYVLNNYGGFDHMFSFRLKVMMEPFSKSARNGKIARKMKGKKHVGCIWK